MRAGSLPKSWFSSIARPPWPPSIRDVNSPTSINHEIALPPPSVGCCLFRCAARHGATRQRRARQCHPARCAGSRPMHQRTDLRHHRGCHAQPRGHLQHQLGGRMVRAFHGQPHAGLYRTGDDPTGSTRRRRTRPGSVRWPHQPVHPLRHRHTVCLRCRNGRQQGPRVQQHAGPVQHLRAKPRGRRHVRVLHRGQQRRRRGELLPAFRHHGGRHPQRR